VFRVLWLFKKALPSREEQHISLSIVNSKARFSPKRGSTFIHIEMILYVVYWTCDVR